jgi:hypothetical protein
MTAAREVHAEGWCIRLDIGRQVLRLEVPDADSGGHPRGRKSAGPPLLPLLPLAADGPASAATLLMKAK